MRVIGLMSGTSMDAIDAAVVDIDDAIFDRAPGEQPSPHDGVLHVTLRTFVEEPYPDATRGALERAINASATNVPLAALASLNVAIGEAFANAARVARKEAAVPIDLIGSHGQTVAHVVRPPAGSDLWPATLQLGEPAVIAARTGITCVADFRVADVAAGGQGAPLVSFVDYLLLRSPTEFRVVLNIGGIANVTLLPRRATPQDVVAYDTGPGNMALDAAMQMLYSDGPGYDRNGQTAARGAVAASLLGLLLEDPYFKLAPPKTTGREQFGMAFVERAWAKAQTLGCTSDDFMATLTALSARTIAASIPPACDQVIASGGGVHNKTLMRALEGEFAGKANPPVLVTSDAYAMPPDAKEAMAFAVLAVAALRGQPANLPHATGAHDMVVLGKLVPGCNFSTLMRSAWGQGP